MLHDDGSVVEVSALRPQSWIDSQDLPVGLEIDLSLPERPELCRAIVTNIGPCPPICQGEGELVIATYRTVHRVPILNVLLAGGESIRGTIDHRIWSHRDQQWKQLEELEPGETVQTRFGPLPAISSRLEKARQRVYNLEVRGQHVYEISRSGVLVHNNGDAHEEIIRQLAKNGKKNADDAVEKVTRKADDFLTGPDGKPIPGKWIKVDPKTLEPLLKTRIPKSQIRKLADDIPDRFKQTPFLEESGREFAERVLREVGEFDPNQVGPTSLFNRIKKFADRHFE